MKDAGKRISFTYSFIHPRPVELKERTAYILRLGRSTLTLYMCVDYVHLAQQQCHMTRERKVNTQGITIAKQGIKINTRINHHHNDLTCVARQTRLTGRATLIAAASERAPTSSNHGFEPLRRYSLEPRVRTCGMWHAYALCFCVLDFVRFVSGCGGMWVLEAKTWGKGGECLVCECAWKRELWVWFMAYRFFEQWLVKERHTSPSYRSKHDTSGTSLEMRMQYRFVNPLSHHRKHTKARQEMLGRSGRSIEQICCGVLVKRVKRNSNGTLLVDAVPIDP